MCGLSDGRGTGRRDARATIKFPRKFRYQPQSTSGLPRVERLPQLRGSAEVGFAEEIEGGSKFEESGLSAVAQDSKRAGNFQATLNRERTSGGFIEQQHVGVKLFSEAQRRALTGVKRRQCFVRLFRVGMNF